MATARKPPPPRSLARLYLAHQELRKDFDALVQCLVTYTWGEVCPTKLHRERFRDVLQRFPPPAGAPLPSLPDVLEPDLLRTVLQQCGGDQEEMLSLRGVSSVCEAHVAAVQAEKLYVFGGDGAPSGNSHNSAESFDVRKGRWEAIPPMKLRRAGCVAGVLGGRIYICGGRDGMERGIEEFDPKIQKWDNTPPVPKLNATRFNAAAAAVDGRLYICGGEDPSDGVVHGSVECFDPGLGGRRGRCVQLPAVMLAPRRSFAAAAMPGEGNAIVVCGGVDTPSGQHGDPNLTPPHASAEALHLAGGKDTWQPLAPLAGPRQDHAAAALQRSIYICGGRCGDGSATSSVECYSAASGVWSTLRPLSMPRVGPAMAAIGGFMYAFGGFPFRSFRSVERYDPSKDTWESVPEMLQARATFCAVAVKVRDLVALGPPVARESSAGEVRVEAVHSK